MPKFLIVQTAFPGDVVLATALVESLHAAHPQAAIDFLVRRGTEGLLAGHPHIRQVLIWNKSHRKYRHLIRLLRNIRRARYTHAICVQRFAAAGLLVGLSGAEQRIGFQKNPLHFLFTAAHPHVISGRDDVQPVHETSRNHALIAGIAAPQPARPRLYPTPADYATVAALQAAGSYVCMAPASVWATKQYPAERWLELIQALPARYTVYLLGGPGDAALTQRIAAGARTGNVQNLCGSLSFLQSAALMQGAAMNYANDSAPLHIAGAVGAPVTAIFCSTVPRFGFWPLGEAARVVKHPGPLYCRPCGLHGRRACPEGHFRCALEVRLDDLLWWTQEVGRPH